MRISEVFGILSGPLNFVFSQLATYKFSEVIRIGEETGVFGSQSLKHLQGIDLIQRVLILARFFGADINAHDLEVHKSLIFIYRT